MPDLKPASRADGTRSNPAAQKVRFTEAQNSRIHRACKRRGITVQTFLHDAALAALAKHEDEADRDRDRGGPLRRDERRKQAPTGLGIRDRIAEVMQREADAAPPTPPVVVQVAPAAASSASEVAILAGYVANGGRLKREERMRAVLDVVRQGAASGEAIRATRNAIEAELARLDGRAAAIEAEPKRLSALDWLRGDR